MNELSLQGHSLECTTLKKFNSGLLVHLFKTDKSTSHPPRVVKNTTDVPH